MKTNSKLLFGKSNITRIVNLEIQDSTTTIFRELENGEIERSEISNQFWLLSNQKLDNNFIRLEGNLYYKWGKQYENRSEFMQDRQQYKKYDCFSIYDEREATLIKDGYTFVKDMSPFDISICAMDIETTGLNPNNKDAKILLIANTFRKLGKYERKLFCYDQYENESKMLLAWCDWIRHHNPSFILGHNVFGFDLHYINERAKYHGIELTLGRDNSLLKKGKFEKKFRVDGSRDLSYYDYRIWGREIIDTMHLAYKYDAYTRKYNSYGLKPIMKYEGWGDPNRPEYDASKIRENFLNPIEWEKIKSYCRADGDDCIILFDKMIPPFFYQTQSIAKPIQKIMQSASGSQLNSIMLRAYLQDGHSIPKSDESNEYQGAYSLGIPGVYSNCIKWDISSLYPSIIIEYNISPGYKDPNHYFMELVKYFREERLKNKQLAKETQNLHYSHLEQSQKIFINSLFGFMSTPGLNFNNPSGAASITKYGREILNKAIIWATNKSYSEWELINE